MIVLPDTKTFDSNIRLVQLVGGVTKVNMLKVCDKLDLYVSPNLKKDETARRVAQELLDSSIEILSSLNKINNTQKYSIECRIHRVSDKYFRIIIQKNKTSLGWFFYASFLINFKKYFYSLFLDNKKKPPDWEALDHSINDCCFRRLEHHQI